MAVAHDASSESHTGTTGSASEASFTWNHAGASSGVKGVLVFVFNCGGTNANDDVTSVTYGGVSMTAVPGGSAADTATEAGRTKAYFLGASVPQGTQAVVVNRTNNVDILYANAITVTAAADTETNGVVLLQENQTLAEQSITDGSTGVNSLRYAGVYYGGSSFPAPGANSTALQSIIIATSRSAGSVRETTAGQGSRSVGVVAGTSDDVAAVFLAVREVVAVNASPTPSVVAAIAAVSAPTTAADAGISASVVAGLAAVAAPTVAANAGVAPAVVAGIAAIAAPTVVATSPDANVTLVRVTAVAAVGAPVTSAGANVTIVTVAAVASVGTPVIVATAAVAPVVVAAVAAVSAPVTAADARAPPNIVAAVAAVGTPTVASNAGVAPSAVGATAGLGSPGVSADANVALVTVAVNSSVTPPGEVANADVTLASVAAVASVPAPQVDVVSNADVALATVTSVVAIGTPSVTTGDEEQILGGWLPELRLPAVSGEIRQVMPAFTQKLVGDVNDDEQVVLLVMS